MTNGADVTRRELITAMAGFGAALAASTAAGEAPREGHAMLAPAAPLSAEHKAGIAATADCLRAGRACLARCTEHLAAGMAGMAECQRAVMNMLAVVEAMADVAGFANAAPANLKALAATCAGFCDTCASACEPHAAHHEECAACRESCLACVKACRALAG